MVYKRVIKRKGLESCMIRGIFFDLDDTLYNYQRCHKIALKQCYKFLKKYKSLSERNFLRLFSDARLEIKNELDGTAASHNRILYFQRLIEKLLNTFDVSIILGLYSIYWGTLLKVMKPQKEVKELFKKLKKNGIAIVIVTDLTAHIQMRKIRKLGLGKYIDYVVTSEEVGRDKPYPGMFLLALQRAQLSPTEVIMVGNDLEKDIEAANELGLHTVLLEKQKVHAKGKWKPSYQIKNFKSLDSIIFCNEYCKR